MNTLEHMMNVDNLLIHSRHEFNKQPVELHTLFAMSHSFVHMYLKQLPNNVHVSVMEADSFHSS